MLTQNGFHFYTLDNPKRNLRVKSSFMIIRAKYLGMNLTKETKTLLKERKDLNK